MSRKHTSKNTFDPSRNGQASGESAPASLPDAGDSLENLEDLVKAARLPDTLPPAPEVSSHLTRVRVGKPTSQAFVRVRPGADWVLDTLVLERVRTGRKYLVLIEDLMVREEVRARKWAKIVRLHAAIDHYGNAFLWEIPLFDLQGNMNEWNVSQMDAAEEAENVWVQLVSNRVTKSYDWLTSVAFGDPVWPAESLNTWLHLAFGKGKWILRTADDPVIAELRGTRYVP